MIGSMIEVWIYLAMAVIVVLGIVLCLVPLIKVRATLRKAAGRLSEKKSDGSYAYYDPYFLNFKPLDSYWVRFLNNLELMRKNHFVCEITDFINNQTAITEPGRSAFGEMIPGALTTLGIIGTFYGIVYGLSSLNLADTATLEQGITKLILGMHTAFNTSIVGAVLAICFQMIRRAVIGSAQQSLNDFTNACQAQIMSMLTPEATMTQTLHSILEELRRINRVR